MNFLKFKINFNVLFQNQNGGLGILWLCGDQLLAAVTLMNQTFEFLACTTKEIVKRGVGESDI